MRVLLVQTAYLGDIVLTTSLIGELKRVHPRAHLTVLTTRAGRALLEVDSRVDATLELDKSWSPRGAATHAGVLRGLGRGRFDVAIAAQRSMRSGGFVWLSRAPVRIGFVDAPGAWAYTSAVPWSSGRHAVQRYLTLSVPVGGNAERAEARPRLTVDARAARRVEELLGHERAIVCIAPGSVRPTKRWLAEGFGAVASAVRERDLEPVIVGSPDERGLCESVAREAGGAVRVVAGRIGVADLVALIARARAVVANDSGAGHVAAAVSTPVVSIFGPTSPNQGYVPFGPAVGLVEHGALACRPCSSHGPRRCPLGHFKCMRELPPSAVVAQLDRLLEASRAPDPG